MCPLKGVFFLHCGHICWNDPEPCDFAQQLATRTGDKTYRCAKLVFGSSEVVSEWHRCQQCGTTNILLTLVRSQSPLDEAHRVPTAAMLPDIASFQNPDNSFPQILDPVSSTPQTSELQNYAKQALAIFREPEAAPTSGASLSTPTLEGNFDPIEGSTTFELLTPMDEEQEDVCVARAVKESGVSRTTAKAVFVAWKQKLDARTLQ